MANNYIDKIEVNGEVRDIQDTTARQSLKSVVNPNLLINGDFRAGCLVDQRQGKIVPAGKEYYIAGESTPAGLTTKAYTVTLDTGGSGNYIFYLDDGTACVTSAANVVRGYAGAGYGIDMWKTEGSGTVTITDEGITLQKTSGAEYFVFETFLERSRVNAADTVSLSVLTGSALHTLAGTIQAGTVVASLTANINDRFEIYDVDAFPGVHIARFVIVSDTPILLRACKLELGDTQTLAHKTDSGEIVLNDIPLYSDTLAKCQRYFEKSAWNVCLAIATTTTQIEFCGSYYFKVQKRVPPAITIQQPFQVPAVHDTVTGADYTDIEIQLPAALNTYMISPKIYDSKGRFVVGRVYQVMVGDGQYNISAEL